MLVIVASEEVMYCLAWKSYSLLSFVRLLRSTSLSSLLTTTLKGRLLEFPVDGFVSVKPDSAETSACLASSAQIPSFHALKSSSRFSLSSPSPYL